jgi:DNA-directed RNA polymerase specialized sigma24 family protein
MDEPGSVSRWLADLQAGDREAIAPLWERYFTRLVALARARLGGTPRQAVDEEDVALSAFACFCRAAEEGRLTDLRDRDGLWRLLVTLTARKVIDQRRRESSLKRGGGEVLLTLEEVVGEEPTPQFAAEVADEYRYLLSRLPDAELVTIALLKLEGHTSEEIAERLGYVGRTIERKLHLIRTLWSREDSREPSVRDTN